MNTIRFIIGLALIALLGAACNKGPSCPAYNHLHNTKFHADNPNNKPTTPENNKADVEKRREAELNGKGNKAKNKRSYSLFPKWMGVKSR